MHGVRYKCVVLYDTTMADENREGDGVSEDTSVRVKVETWQKLKEMKQYPNQSFDDVISELIEEQKSGESGNVTPARTTAD